MLREGLVRLLAGEAGVRVSGGLAASTLIQTVPADVYAWQAGADPELAAAQLRQFAGSETPALVLVQKPEHAGGMLAAGGRGVMATQGLRERGGHARLVAGLRATAAGFVVNDTSVPKPQAPALTLREGQVVRLLAEGHPNKIIADKLNISEHTAKFHVNALIHKLRAQSRTDAVARAMRAGLISA